MPETGKYRTWRKASKSDANGGCVEVSFDVPGVVAVRHSVLGDDSPVLEFSDFEYECFTDGILQGELQRPR